MPAHDFKSKCLWEDCLYSDTGEDYCYFPSLFEASPAQIPTFSKKTFHCLFFVTGGNTQTDLRIRLFPSGMPSQCSFIRVGFVGLANFTLYQYPVFQVF